MPSPFLQFLTRLSVFSIVLGIITLVIFRIVPNGYASVAIPYQFILFFSVTLIVHYSLLKGFEKSPGRFIARYMLVSFLKLIFYLVVLVIYMLLNKNEIIRFIVPYFILYILYTSFEIYALISYSNKQKTSHNASRP